MLFPFGFGVHVFISKNAVLYSERTYYKQIFDKNFFIVFLATSTFGSGKVGKKNGAFMAWTLLYNSILIENMEIKMGLVGKKIIGPL